MLCSQIQFFSDVVRLINCYIIIIIIIVQPTSTVCRCNIDAGSQTVKRGSRTRLSGDSSM